MNKKEEQYQITHRKIITTVTEMLGTTPFEEITIRDICRKCAISIGNFYHHFHNKEEILQMEYEYFDQRLQEYFLAEKSFHSSREKLLYLFEVELLSIRDIGHYAAAQIFRTQLLFDEPFILEQNRFFYEELIATASEYMKDYHIHESPQNFVEELLRISRGNIYDWCLHHGSYDLVTVSLSTIKKMIACTERSSTDLSDNKQDVSITVL